MLVEELLQFLEIILQCVDQIPLMKSGGRVQEGEDHEVLHVERLRFHLGNADLAFQQCLSRPITKRTHELGPDHLDLLHEKRFTSFHFIRFRVAVVRRPALDDVRDIDLVARKIRRRQQIVEEFTRSPHERLPLLIFIEPRRFADEHDARAWISHAEDHLGPAQLREFALLAVMK